MATLPAPHTTTDMLLVALHEEIVGLRSDLASGRGGERPPAGKAVLEEPASRSAKTRSPKGT